MTNEQITNEQTTNEKTPGQPPVNPSDIPVHQGAKSLQACLEGLIELGPLDDMILELHDIINAGGGELESLMAMQARVLDSVFNRSIAWGVDKESYSEARISLALRAQKQCSTTVKTLRQLQGGLLSDKTQILKAVTNKLKESQ